MNLFLNFMLPLSIYARYYLERSHSQCEVSSSSTGRDFQGVPSAGLRIRPSRLFVAIPRVIWPWHLVASAGKPAKGQRPKQHLQQNNSDYQRILTVTRCIYIVDVDSAYINKTK